MEARQRTFAFSLHRLAKMSDAVSVAATAATAPADAPDQQADQASKQATPAPNTDKKEIVFVPPKLAEILDMAKISAENPKTITEIWRMFHEGKYAVCATIPRDTYLKISERAKRYPRFLLPVLRDEGGVVEFFTTEFHDDNILVTSLAEYKLRGARSSPVLIMRHYRELEASKQLVLMRGQIDPSRLSVAEAGIIANQFQLHYLQDTFYKQVRVFNETPEKFDVQNLLAVYLGRGKLQNPRPSAQPAKSQPQSGQSSKGAKAAPSTGKSQTKSSSNEPKK